MAFVHLVARAREGARPLAAPGQAWRLWRRLRAVFPLVTAAALMPDHLHLLLPADVHRPLLPVLRGVLGGATRQLGAAARWTIAAPAPVADTKHLRRTVRYLHLNAPRAGLVADPLAWPWSTHRGALGAEADPWVRAEELAAALGRPTRAASLPAQVRWRTFPGRFLTGSLPTGQSCASLRRPVAARWT